MSHQSTRNAKSAKTVVGNSRSEPITVENEGYVVPQFDFKASLNDVWQETVPEETIVAEQHGCSVTSHDLYTLKPKE